MCQKRFTIISNIVSIAVIMTALVAAVRVNAATVTSANDTVTSLQTSISANHEVLFTTSSGILEGQTVTLTFDSGFTTSSLIEDDVDVADNGSELTTASTCAGPEKASVAISSNIVTITICVGDGGAIVSGHSVRVRMGTNAVSSGIGTHQITNPSGAANHFVTIGGTFGDSGSIVLSMKSSSSAISVTASVPSPSGGGSGGGTNSDNTGDKTQVDSVAPVLSQIIVSAVTKSEATVSWTTDEDTTAKVNYGLTNAFELGLVLDTSFTKSHALGLSNLQEGKTYYFQVKSADKSNNVVTSSVMMFNTLDQTPPVVSSISVSNITKSSATIGWTTNEPVASVLDYGHSTGYGINKTSATLTTDHSFVISGLESGITYHFRVKSSDASSNETTSTDQTFATLADLPPTNVSGMDIVAGDKTLTLSWTNPTDDDFAGVRVLRCLSGFPSDPTDGSCSIVLDSSTAQTLVQIGLTNKTTYYYGVFSKDMALQFASGALVSGQPSAPEKEVQKDVCGDSVCSATETVSSCPADCTAPIRNGAVCGDNVCANSESTASCPADCAVQTPTSGGTCGNGICDHAESAFTCPFDCKEAVQNQTPGSGAVGTFQFSDITFSIGNGSIHLSSTDGSIAVLPHTALSVRVPANALPAGVDRVTLTLGSDSYLLRPVTKIIAASIEIAATTGTASVLSYEADVFSPSALSLNPVTIFVEKTNGQSFTVSSFLNVVAPGNTKEIIDGEETAVKGSTVTLYQGSVINGVVWDGSPYGEPNPSTTTSNGSFGWYVPNGLYSVHAEHDAYASIDTPVLDVKNNIVNPHILMTLLVKKEVPLKTATDAVLSVVVGKDAAKQIAATIQNITNSKAIQAVSKGLETVRANPIVQTAADVSVPTLVVSAGSSVIVMSVAFDFLPFLQYLFTAPILFFGRRKRKAFGVIYNAISKEPIGLAVVRLYQVKDEQELKGKLVKSRVTDKGGRFFFLVQPGLYRLAVTKFGFQFPTQHLSAKKEDAQYIDLYHGELLRVTEADAVITPNIPVDPSSAAQFQEPKNIQWRARLRAIQHIIALSGVIVSLVFAIIRPNVLAAAMVLIQVGVYVFVQRLVKPRKPKSWGIVYDKNSGRPLANVVARIFEPKYNKLLETQVTDNKGRYSFLLGPSEYYAVFEKEGYRSTQINPIDYSKDQEAKDFSQDIHLFTKETQPPPILSPS